MPNPSSSLKNGPVKQEVEPPLQSWLRSLQQAGSNLMPLISVQGPAYLVSPVFFAAGGCQQWTVISTCCRTLASIRSRPVHVQG